MDKLQAGIEFTLAVFPRLSIFLQPGKAALNNPAFGHDLEGMQLTPLGNLHCEGLSQDFSHAVVTAMACGNPCVSTAIWCLMPDTFLPAS